MPTSLPFFTLLFGVALPVFAIQPTTKVISQPGAPIEIASYRAAYSPGSGAYIPEGIQHVVEYMNVSGKIVDAVQIGLVSFDVWNEFLDRTLGLATDSLAMHATKKGTWVARAYGDFSFLTGLAYVSKVRFRDGEIWKADLDSIASELRQVQQDFDVTNLKKQPGPSNVH
jgi:hypothetical protein